MVAWKARVAAAGARSGESLPVSGAVAWYAARLQSGLSDGDSISSYSDSSGEGNDATQANSTLQPIFKENVLNGHPVARFDSAGNDRLQLSIAVTDIRSVFWVVSQASYVSYAPSLLGHNSAYHFHRGNGGLFNHFASSHINNGSIKVNGVAETSNYGLTDANWRIISLVTTGHVSANLLTIDRNLGGRSWRGDIAEIIIFNTALSATDVDVMEGYLNDLYNIY